MFICSVVSNSLQSHVLQNARFLCPSPFPGVFSNSCPLSRWCHPTITSSVILFSSCLQSFPASGSFPMSQLLASSGQSIGSSASTFPMNIQDSLKASILWRSAYFMIWFSHLYVTAGKTIALIIWTFVGKVMSLLFNMWPRFVIAFLPRSKHFLISWLQALSAVILEPKKIKSVTVSITSSSICDEVMGPDAMVFFFWMLSSSHWSSCNLAESLLKEVRSWGFLVVEIILIHQVFLRQALTLFQLVSTHRSEGRMEEWGAGPHSIYLMGVLASNFKIIIILWASTFFGCCYHEKAYTCKKFGQHWSV